MPRIIYIFVYWLHTWKYIRTLENATLISKPAIPFWRTSQSTDHGPDYWNHGPIFIPGEERYTLTTKNPEIFPPWLTRTVPSEFPFPFINMTTIRRIMHKTSSTVASVIPQKLNVNISNGVTTDKAKQTLTKTTTDIIAKELNLTSAKTSKTKDMAITKPTETMKNMITPVVPKFTKSSITTTDTAITKLTTIKNMITPGVPKFTKTSSTTTDTPIQLTKNIMRNMIAPGKPKPKTVTTTTNTPILTLAGTMINMISPKVLKHTKSSRMTTNPGDDDVFGIGMHSLSDLDYDFGHYNHKALPRYQDKLTDATVIPKPNSKTPVTDREMAGYDLGHNKHKALPRFQDKLTDATVIPKPNSKTPVTDREMADYDFGHYKHKALPRFQDKLTDATVIPKPNSKLPVTDREMAITKKHFKYKERTAPTSEADTEPFSVFLRNFLKALSLKSPFNLSALVEAFIKHVSDLILSGKCTVLGLETNVYLMKILRDMNGTPEALQKNLNQAYDIMMHRPVLMAADINELLNYMDDMYDEAEEEAMQQVLTLVKQFPEIRTTAAEIAQSFVNAVFLNPMQRVSGSWEAKTLFNMITNVVNKRMSVHRRFLENAETYNFFKEPQLIDEYVKFKSPRDDRNVFANVDTNEVKNYRRKLFPVNNQRNAGISEISRYGIITGRKKRDDRSKRHKTLRPNFLIEDTDEKYDDIEIKVRDTSKNTHKSNTQTQRKSYEGKMRISPQQANINKEVHLHKSISSIADGLNWFRKELGADKNNLDKNQKLITSANNENRTQGFYSWPHSHKTEKYNFRRHTILSPDGDISTKRIIYDVPKYDDNIHGDDYSKYRNAIKNHVKYESTKKLYSKSPIYKALHDYHLPTNKTSKPIRPIHPRSKYWTTNGIKYTPSAKPKLNNDKMAPQMKTYTKQPYNSKNIYRNNEPVHKTIANSRNKKVEDVSNKKAHTYAEDKIAHGDLYRNTSLFINKKNKYNTVKSEQHNKLRYTFSNKNLKRYMQSTTQDKALRNKSLVTNNKFKTYSGLFHQRMKPVSQNIQNNKLSTKTPWSSLHFGGPGNSKQLHQNTVKQTNNKYTPYKTKTTTKKSVKSIAMIRIKNKTVTQDNEVEQLLYDEEDEISDIYDDDSTSESVSSTSSDRSSGDSGEIIESKTTRSPATTELRFTKSYPWHDPIFRENTKRKHHKNKHKKKHKHGHKHSYYSRKKYEKLKRKYRKLKRLRGLLIEQRQLYANRGKTAFQKPATNTPDYIAPVVTETTVTTNKILESPGIDEKIKRARPIEYNYGDEEPEEIDDQKQSEIAPDQSYHYDDSINLFLEDYGVNGIPLSRRGGLHRNRINSKSSRIIDDSDIQRIAGIKNKNITFVRRSPESSKVNKLPIFKPKEGNSEELELEKNLHDALRHMDFNKKYYNMSRRSMVHGHSDEVVPDDSYNTDLEAVLKRNIYKTVKKLLEK